MSKLNLDNSKLSNRCFLYIYNFFRGFTGTQCLLFSGISYIVKNEDTLLWFEKVLVVSQGLNSQLLPFLLLVILALCYLEAGLVYLIMKILLKS